MNVRRVVGPILILACLARVPTSAAVDFTPAERKALGNLTIDEDLPLSPAGAYLATAETRLVRGAVNMATFPVDALTCPMQSAVIFAHDPVVMTLVNVPFSVAEGVFRSAFRVFSGTFDAVTFWVPGIEGFAPPPTYGCMDRVRQRPARD